MIRPLRRPQAIASINITNLVDVTMVLLIIFMMVTPLINEGVEVKPPESETTKPLETGKNIMVTISEEGELYLQGQVYSGLDSLREGLVALTREEPEWPLLVKCDREQRVDLLFKVMSLAQNVRPGREIGIVGQTPSPGSDG